MPEPDITGPSDTTPQGPVISMGTVSTPFVRTGIQASLATGLIRLVEVLPNPDLVISSGDRDIIFIVATGAVCLAQNVLEKVKGRRLIGAPA